MGKNKHIQHKHITCENNNGDKVEVFYHNHYGSEGYQVTKVNDDNARTGEAWETLENAIKSTEK